MREESTKQGIVKYVAKNHDGILLEGDEQWYNYGGVDKQGMQTKVAAINKGDMIDLILTEDHKYGEVMVTSKAPKASITGSFMEDYKGLEELLNEAHTLVIGNLTIQSELLECDWENKRAVCRVTVQGDIGSWKAGETLPDSIRRRVTSGIGDASPDSIGTSNIEPHFVRMAETRALVRALRWFTNNGATAAEELPQ